MPFGEEDDIPTLIFEPWGMFQNISKGNILHDIAPVRTFHSDFFHFLFLFLLTDGRCRFQNGV